MFFFTGTPPKKFKYGKPRLGESTLTKIVLDTPNLAWINFFVLGTFLGGTSEKKHPVFWSVPQTTSMLKSSVIRGKGEKEKFSKTDRRMTGGKTKQKHNELF